MFGFYLSFFFLIFLSFGFFFVMQNLKQHFGFCCSFLGCKSDFCLALSTNQTCSLPLVCDGGGSVVELYVEDFFSLFFCFCGGCVEILSLFFFRVLDN